MTEPSARLSFKQNFAVTLAVYLVLGTVAAMQGLWFEDRYPSGLAALEHASEIQLLSRVSYLLGLYVLRFPFGTLLAWCDPGPLVSLMSSASIVPNALLAALVLHRLRSRRRDRHFAS